MAGSSSFMHFQHYQQHPQHRHPSNNSAAAAQIASSSLYAPGYAYYDAASATTYRNVTSVASNYGARPPASIPQYQQSQTSPTHAPPAAPSFRAPAHKNSHHLHTIPPREKSTRTLIVDHMIWVHGRTRLAQARAELGMTDRTGGPSSTNYAHRTRPENYEEEDEVDSEGEDGNVLLGWTDDSESTARPSGGVQVKDEREKKEKERLERQDLPLARTLRLRAEGLEKVVTSMLGQPPPLQPAPPHPVTSSFHPPSSSVSHPSGPSGSTASTLPFPAATLGLSSGHQHDSDSHLHGHSHSHSTSSRTRTGRHPHILPNGVRLRLALGTLINDFFARQAPHPPYRHTQTRKASRASSPSLKPPSTSKSGHEDGSEGRDEEGKEESKAEKMAAEMDLPEALLPLTLISGGIRDLPPNSSLSASFSDEQDEDEDEEDENMEGSPSSYALEYPTGYAGYGIETTASFYQPTQSPVGLSPFAVPDFHQQQQYQSFSLSQPEQYPPSGSSPLRPPAHIAQGDARRKKSRTKPKPSPRTVELYSAGADAASTAPSPSFRCPRHLYVGCQVCVEAQSGSTVGGSSSKGGFKVGGAPTRGSGAGSISIGVSSGQGVGMVGDTTSFTSSTTASTSALAGVSGAAAAGIGVAPDGGNITGWKDGSGIGTGLLRPDLRGSVLRRAVVLPGSPSQPSNANPDGKSPTGPIHRRSPSVPARLQPLSQTPSPQRKKGGVKPGEPNYEQETGAGNTKLSKLIPRFIKLSALVAGELGREIRGEEVDTSAALQTDGPTTPVVATGPAGTAQAGEGTNAGDDADESESDSDSESGSDRTRGKSRRDESATPTPVKREEATPRPSSSPLKPATATPSSATTSPAQPLPPHLLGQKHNHHHGHHHHLNHIRHGKRAHEKMYAYALQPTREWYLLLAGLLTRAVLEGYLTAGWNGIGSVECLMGVGVGVGKRKPTTPSNQEGDGKEGEDDSEDEDDYADEDDALFEEVEPDEYPTLKEALRVLFPSLRCGIHGKERDSEEQEKCEKGESEKEYEEEMFRRLRMFYDIPDTTPDLSAHLEDLAWRFPAEPIERAAVRFCESIAKWRGKPELEGYKKKKPSVSGFTSTSPGSSSLTTTFGTTMITMESLVHSNPASPVQATMKRKEERKVGIGAYFSSAADERKKADEKKNLVESVTWSLKRGREDDNKVGEGVFGGVKRARM